MNVRDFNLDTILDQQAAEGGFTYLAAPYSHDDKAIVRQRVRNINKAAGELIARGVLVFSPISHCHPIAEAIELPGSFEYWQRYNAVMLTAASSMTVLTLGGVETSTGVAGELEIACALDHVCYMLNPLYALNLDRV